MYLVLLGAAAVVAVCFPPTTNVYNPTQVVEQTVDEARLREIARQEAACDVSVSASPVEVNVTGLEEIAARVGELEARLPYLKGMDKQLDRMEERVGVVEKAATEAKLASSGAAATIGELDRRVQEVTSGLESRMAQVEADTSGTLKRGELAPMRWICGLTLAAWVVVGGVIFVRSRRAR
jgi:hypothetical protein